jgi:hypothetical protein
MFYRPMPYPFNFQPLTVPAPLHPNLAVLQCTFLFI